MFARVILAGRWVLLSCGCQVEIDGGGTPTYCRVPVTSGR